MDTKTCSKCKEDKDFSQFHKSQSGKFGLKNYCKPCSKIVRKELYQENREEEIEKARNWQKENSERYYEYQKNYKPKE